MVIPSILVYHFNPFKKLSVYLSPLDTCHTSSRSEEGYECVNQSQECYPKQGALDFFFYLCTLCDAGIPGPQFTGRICPGCAYLPLILGKTANFDPRSTLKQHRGKKMVELRRG